MSVQLPESVKIDECGNTKWHLQPLVIIKDAVTRNGHSNKTRTGQIDYARPPNPNGFVWFHTLAVIYFLVFSQVNFIVCCYKAMIPCVRKRCGNSCEMGIPRYDVIYQNVLFDSCASKKYR